MISWNRIYALSLRHLYPLRRDFDLLSDMLYWPMIDTLLWGVTGRWLSDANGGFNYVAAILIGLVMWNIIWRSQSEVSRNLIDEIWNNNLVNLFSTPLSLKEWIVGVLLLSVLKTSFTIVVLIALILVLYSINIFSLGLWLIPFFINATITGWSIGLVSAGIVIRHGPKVQTVVWTLPGILLPFSVVYFPLAMLPTALKPISLLVPTTYVFEGMRTVLAGGSVEPSQLLISFGLNVLYFILGVYWFVISFRVSRNLGLGRF